VPHASKFSPSARAGGYGSFGSAQALVFLPVRQEIVNRSFTQIQ